MKKIVGFIVFIYISFFFGYLIGRNHNADITISAYDFNNTKSACKKNDGLKTITFKNGRVFKIKCDDGASFEWPHNEDFDLSTKSNRK